MILVRTYPVKYTFYDKKFTISFIIWYCSLRFMNDLVLLQLRPTFKTLLKEPRSCTKKMHLLSCDSCSHLLYSIACDKILETEIAQRGGLL